MRLRIGSLGIVVLALALVAGIGGAQKKEYSRELLLHPFLSDDLAQWLVGPIARLAGEDGIAAYLAVRDDDAARAFIESF